MLESAALCLAVAIYHEARGEPHVGKRAVAEVVLNRVRSPHFPDTVCGVVFQPHQFSNIRRSARKNVAAELPLARRMLRGELPRVLPRDTTHYHNTTVSPAWATVMRVVGHIGNHIFYRRTS